MRRIARLLSYGGSVAIVFALSVYHARYISVPVYDFTNSTRFSWAIAYTVLLEITAYAFGMPDQPRSTRQAAWLASLAVGISVVAISMAQLVLGDIFLPRFVIFGSAVLIVPWQVLLNAFSRSTTTRHQNRDRILFVGKESEEARLAHDLTQSPEKAATFVGGLTPDAAAEGDPHAERSPLTMALERTQATVLVLDRSAQDDERVVGQVAELHELGIRIRTLQGAYEEWLGKLPLSELERASLLFDIGEIHGIHYGQLKRMMDLTLGMLGAVVLVLITPFVLIGNLLANRGPITYRQPRVGKGGETFTILKFRTMTNSPIRDVAPEDPDAPTTTWTQQDDPRVTPFGKLLRPATSMNCPR
ncbi:MAG: sugar transferase [Microthrixaceae bacterium]